MLYDKNITQSSQKSYSDRCTLGLKDAIDSVLSNTLINLTSVIFESDKQQLNKTYLDSFNLIVVGGITYWWNFASAHQRDSLLKTTTPILSSASLGISSSPYLNALTGVYSNKSDYDTWATSVLPSDLTKIIYLASPESSFRYSETSSVLHIIDVTTFYDAKILAHASRGNFTYPYLIFNGTKNYHINSYTYSSISQIKIDLMWILPQTLELPIESFFNQRDAVDQNLVFNTFLLLFNVFSLFYFIFPFVKILKFKKLSVRINLCNFKRNLICNTLIVLVLFLIVYFFEIFLNTLLSKTFSSAYLFYVVCVLIASTSFFCIDE